MAGELGVLIYLLVKPRYWFGNRRVELPMSEAQLERAVRDLLKLYGLAEHSYHTHDSRRSQKGFPDWVIAGRDKVLFRELKSSEGRVSRDQRRWISRLQESGQDAEVWRPEDLRSGRISKELAALLR